MPERMSELSSALAPARCVQVCTSKEGRTDIGSMKGSEVHRRLSLPLAVALLSVGAVAGQILVPLFRKIKVRQINLQAAQEALLQILFACRSLMILKAVNGAGAQGQRPPEGCCECRRPTVRQRYCFDNSSLPEPCTDERSASERTETHCGNHTLALLSFRPVRSYVFNSTPKEGWLEVRSSDEGRPATYLHLASTRRILPLLGRLSHLGGDWSAGQG